MLRNLKFLFAAVFAFCLFTLLPAWAMNETSAFSVGAKKKIVYSSSNAAAITAPDRADRFIAAHEMRARNAESENAPETVATVKLKEVSDHRRDTPDLTCSLGLKNFDLPPNYHANGTIERNPATNNAYPANRVYPNRTAFILRL